MTTNELISYLESFNYPKLERNLKELNLLGVVHVENSHAEIELLSVSDDSFETLKKALISELSTTFNSLHVKQKVHAKEKMNYGHTSTPNNRAPYAKNVIAVTSGKGGVGKSTVSVNLAIALAQQGYSVGILDADVYGPNIPRLTKTDTERIKWNDEDKIIPSENYGIKIMSVALTTPRMDTPLVWRSSVAVQALTQFLDDVAWGELDFMVIDMPPGTGDIQLTMAQELPITAAVLVTTPQLVSTDDVSRAIMMFKDINVPMAGLIENMSYFIAPDTKNRYNIFGSGGGEKIAKKYDINLLAEIPIDMDIREGSDKGEPSVVFNTDIKNSYKIIIDKILKNIPFNQ